MGSRRLVMLVLLLFCVIVAGSLYAQKPTDRTIIIDSFDNLSAYSVPVRPGESVTYRLANCPSTEAPCAIVITAQSANQPGRGIQTQSTTGVLICGMDIYNGFQAHVGHLEERAPATFYQQFGKVPLSWNSLPSTTGTWASLGYWWSYLESAIFPPVGQQAVYAAWAQTRGTFNYPGGSRSYLVQIDVTGSGWSCIGL